MSSSIMVASTGSGRGKTTFTIGLLALLKNRGCDVHAFKCGPDYIDPMFHRDILGVPSVNLDSFFCNNALLMDTFNRNSGDVNVIEAAMGLYDGLGVSSVNSAYEVASCLNTPIVLVVDAYGMGYSIIAEIKGFLSMDKCNLIKGIVLNRISSNYFSKIKTVIEEELNVQVFGFLPKISGAELKSRHLGLMSPDENNLTEKIKAISLSIEMNVNVDELIYVNNHKADNVAEKADYTAEISDIYVNDTSVLHSNISNAHFKVAVAKDEAFSFIYEENISAIKRVGGDIIYFSPIHDKEVPKGISGLILPGGYPENYLHQLSENKSMLKSIKETIEGGVYTLAECGGYMYLLQGIEDSGDVYPMAGVLKGVAYREKGLVRFGYVCIETSEGQIKSHEFHHYDVTDGEDFSDKYIVKKASTNEEYRAIIEKYNLVAGFPHLYYPGSEFILRGFYE